ncbi:olfactory receptor 7A10-like, partial [Sorex araneus]|uniref:olfactory receptor 7A10-like n=1 Tax=Sorex araneus TaxID=42254 RepID=UPI002433EAFD
FFLSNLSFVDICFTSTTVPKMLLNIQTHSKAISYADCITQMYFFLLFVVMESCLLAVMAYDRFVAICHPLHYTVIMNPRVCGLLLLLCWCVSVLDSVVESLTVLWLSFCTDVEIPHFFCELNQMIHLACSDTFVSDVVMYVAALLVAGGGFTGIIYSYTKIVSSIRRISSAQGKYKAFSTCASHLSVVCLIYGTSLSVYLSSAVTQNSQSTAIAFIYSLRNKDIKRALKNLIGRKTMIGHGS